MIPVLALEMRGYYHYATGTNETYEEVLPKVKAWNGSRWLRFVISFLPKP